MGILVAHQNTRGCKKHTSLLALEKEASIKISKKMKESTKYSTFTPLDSSESSLGFMFDFVMLSKWVLTKLVVPIGHFNTSFALENQICVI
jgi:hypothetical protein